MGGIQLVNTGKGGNGRKEPGKQLCGKTETTQVLEEAKERRPSLATT